MERIREPIRQVADDIRDALVGVEASFAKEDYDAANAYITAASSGLHALTALASSASMLDAAHKKAIEGDEAREEKH